MHPAPAPAQAGPLADRNRARLHLLAISTALTVLAFVQAPGRIAPDTKADLSIDPIGFLLRAAHLWDPLGDSGQLQNQAYGYFLPMGPFFALGRLLGLPPWIVQRAWWSLVLLVAFHGMYRLCARIGVGTHATRIIAALAFALSPRMITELGPVSIEVWPMALAPWVLLPLVRVRPGTQAVAAARSGLAIALCGGVNAVAVGAVLPLPIWWLITRERGPVRRTLARWWALAAVLATFWWVAPLLLLGRFSPPFLDWVESAAASTSKASLPSAWRGTTQWVAYLRTPQPIWLAGWSVLSSPVGIVLGWLLIALSVLGLLRHDTPHRRFLLGAGIGGLALLCFGHVGPLTPPWAPLARAFLDGAGAPLRNTHKFDVVLRVPLAVGLAHALARIRLPAIAVPGLPTLRSGAGLARFAAVCAVLGTGAPALVGQLPATGTYTRIPPAWRQAAAWLQQNDDGARTLIVPGSTFPTSIWGDPHDEPFQSLARTAWASRSGVPLSSAGNIRVLNTIEQQLQTGRGSPGLAAYLARAGISRVLLRSDLARSFQPGSAPLPVIFRAALQGSPGLHPVARFGPLISGRNDVTGFGTVADDGLDVPLAQIEIWQLDQPVPWADVRAASAALRVAGGPESLLTLAEAGRLGSRPVVLAGDPQARALQSAPLTLTDTPQRREATFAQVRDNYSQPMTAAQPYQQLRPVHDWLPLPTGEVVARYLQISSASSSGQAAPETGPWQALDGDPSTAWTSGPLAVGQWLQVRFPAPVSFPAGIRLTPGIGGAQLAAVQVQTAAGPTTTAIPLKPAGPVPTAVPTAVPIAVPAGPTRSLRLTVTRAWPGTELLGDSIAQLDLTGLAPSRPLVLPAPGGTSAPAAIVLQNDRDGVDGCLLDDGRQICSPRLQRQSEDADLDRLVQLPVAAGYAVRASARIRSTPAEDSALDRLLRAGPAAMTAQASSRWAEHPALRPGAAIDRDLGTSWIAAAGDLAPRLTLSWPQPRTIRRLRWQLAAGLAASRPAQLTVTAGGRRLVLTPDDAGRVSFPPIRTARLEITVTGVQPLRSLDRANGFSTVLPVGASEISVSGADDYRLAVPAGLPFDLPCGAGPPLVIGDQVLATRVSGTVGAAVDGLPMPVTACAPVPRLPAAPVRLGLRSTGLLHPVQLVLARTTSPAADDGSAAGAEVQLLGHGREHRIVRVGGSALQRVLNVHENANPGWRATLNGRPLASVRLDGWQQGWIIPAGPAGSIDLRFTPGRSYRLALLAGFGLLALLVGLAVPGRRRRLKISRGALLHRQHLEVTEASSSRWPGLLGGVGVVLTGAGWGLLALLTVLLLRRQRVPWRYLVGAGCALTGVGAALSIDADESGLAATVAIGAALFLLACLAVGLDVAGGGLLAGAMDAVPRLERGRRSEAAGAGTPAAQHGLLDVPPGQ